MEGKIEGDGRTSIKENYDIYLKYNMRTVIARVAHHSESIDDIMAGGWTLGNRRAELLGRDIEIWQDIPFSLAIFCWWPFMPLVSESYQDYVMKIRRPLFNKAYRKEEARERILNAVQREISKMERHMNFANLDTR